MACKVGLSIHAAKELERLDPGVARRILIEHYESS
jgi:hypothetical protein